MVSDRWGLFFEVPYGLLVAGTTIVPAIAGFGMTDWIVRRIVDLPSAQATPLMVSRSSLTVCVHLVVQPLLLLADVLSWGSLSRFDWQRSAG